MILNMLAGGEEMQPFEMSRRIGVSLSATSQHLAKLRAANLVQCRRAAQSRYYRMSPRARELQVDRLVHRFLALM